jgi:hypothetical protein
MANSGNPVQPVGDQPSGLKRLVTSSTTWSVILVIVILGFVGWILWSGTRPIVDQLPDMEFARGIITLIFVLFTIGFAAIVLIQGLFLSDAAQEDRRFSRGREVLGLFIGIVGTIVGFYFGSAEKVTTKFDVAVQAHRQAAPSKDVIITAHAVGGTPPYRFTVSVGSKKVTEQPVRSEDGWLSTRASGDDSTEVTVDVTDAKDLRATKKAKINEAPKEVKEAPKQDKGGPTEDKK